MIIFIVIWKKRFCFAEKSKILAGYRKVILLNYQSNYAERSN